jgi:gliding motility-associated lipoprotein GldD
MRKGIIIIIFLFLLISCGSDFYTPKPKGYFRIDLPEKSYKKIEKDCPFSFEIPDYASVKPNTNNPEQTCWFNLEFNNLNASLYMSYKVVDNNINKYLEDSRTLAFKHTVKAVDIEQQTIKNDSTKVYGLIYDIQGNTASSYQFHLTDSNNHFIRGSLYFNNLPNQDSIQPVLDFVKLDIEHLIETFEWK